MGCLLYALGDDQWDIPALRLLETIIPEHTAIDGFEVHHDFSGIGRRNMPLNARNVLYGASMAVSARSSSRRWSSNWMRPSLDLSAGVSVSLSIRHPSPLSLDKAA